MTSFKLYSLFLKSLIKHSTHTFLFCRDELGSTHLKANICTKVKRINFPMSSVEEVVQKETVCKDSQDSAQ